MAKQQLTFWNGNGKRYLKSSPRLLIFGKMNDVARNHFVKQTGLKLENCSSGYTVENTTWAKIAKLFLTYNFRTRYYNNLDYQNTLMIKDCDDGVWNY